MKLQQEAIFLENILDRGMTVIFNPIHSYIPHLHRKLSARIREP